MAETTTTNLGGANPDCCIAGWVPGEHGVERCDDCKRFPDDDAAAAHVANILSTLRANYGAGTLPQSWERYATRRRIVDADSESPQWRCMACGSTRVQVAEWIDPNTRTIRGETGGGSGFVNDPSDARNHIIALTWCSDCERHRGIEQATEADVMARTLRDIRDERDAHAETGRYPNVGSEQAFDDWAADRAERALQRAGHRLASEPAPTCGHSECSQNYIDTGESGCVRPYCARCEREGLALADRAISTRTWDYVCRPCAASEGIELFESCANCGEAVEQGELRNGRCMLCYQPAQPTLPTVDCPECSEPAIVDGTGPYTRCGSCSSLIDDGGRLIAAGSESGDN